MERIIMHIDVNNAFLSWSAVDLLNNGYKYDIRNSYAVIGGDESRRAGIVLAKSTPCKKLGIQTAETLYQARKKCRVLKVFPPNYAFYQKMSKELFKIISKYTPDIEVASIDECYIDYGKSMLINGDPIKFAYKLQKEINDTLHFTVNIGIANNKLCAKMASDFEKPNKVHTLFQNEVKTKMYPLPVGDLFGIGKKSVLKLNQIGIHKIEDLANYDEKHLAFFFKNQAKHMIELAQGIDDTEVVSERDDCKSISMTTTLPIDITQIDDAYDELRKIAEKIAQNLRKEEKYAYVIAVILKSNSFVTKNHQAKLTNPTNIGIEIYKKAKQLLKEMWDDEPIRLIGIRLDNLVVNYGYQASIFENIDEKIKNEKLEKVIDQIKKKYGNKSINIAKLKKE